jgi:hypothetical protein
VSTIWTDDYLDQLAVDAEQALNVDLPCIFQRAYIPTVAGESVITLPPYVRSLLRVSWMGKKLEPVSWEELILLSPATVGGIIETSQSRPQWYAHHPTNALDIRLYPTPNLTFTPIGDPYSPIINENQCCISFLRDIDTTYTDSTALLPTYVDRRSRKAYILWKAFAAEGKGQNLNAAAYYQNKYNFIVTQFMAINNGCFIAMRYSLGQGDLEVDDYRYPRPTLPTNFERTIY